MRFSAIAWTVVDILPMTEQRRSIRLDFCYAFTMRNICFSGELARNFTHNQLFCSLFGSSTTHLDSVKLRSYKKIRKT